MHTKNLTIYAGSERKDIKNFSAIAPNDYISILLDTLLVEPIYLCDLATLMISTDECHSLGIATLQSHKQNEDLN